LSSLRLAWRWEVTEVLYEPTAVSPS
jgi:hypothetical protein